MKNQKFELEKKLATFETTNEELLIFKDLLKSSIHTMIDVLEKIFVLQINVTPNPILYSEMQAIITTRLIEINKSKFGMNLNDELERLSHLQRKIQEYLKFSENPEYTSDFVQINEANEEYNLTNEVQEMIKKNDLNQKLKNSTISQKSSQNLLNSSDEKSSFLDTITNLKSELSDLNINKPMFYQKCGKILNEDFIQRGCERYKQNKENINSNSIVNSEIKNNSNVIISVSQISEKGQELPKNSNKTNVK